MNLLLLCQHSFILPCTGPQKCDWSVWLPVKIARRQKEILKIHYPLDVSSQKCTKVCFSMTIGILKFPDPRNRDSISVINSMDTFARHFESHRRETWRHTGRRTEPPIFLETPSLPPPPGCFFISNFMTSSTVYAPSLFTFVRFETMIWPSIRFDISLQNFKESVPKNI